MPLEIDDETDRLIRRLAEAKRITPERALLLAIRGEWERTPLAERIWPLQERIAAAGNTGLNADKAFYDSLNDE